MNRTLIVISAIVTCLGSGVPLPAAQPDSQVKRWDFSTDRPGVPPAGFVFSRTGQGHPGRWVIMSSPDAKEQGKILAQTDADATDYRFPMAIAQSPVVRDLRLSVRCEPVAGRVDMACGLVFRYLDENNYYVARANALENNVRLYRVKNGRREQFGAWDGEVAAGKWHDLRADVRGDRLAISWDGRTVIEATDRTFSSPGRIGVWTKADSVTYFKDLQVESPGT